MPHMKIKESNYDEESLALACEDFSGNQLISAAIFMIEDFDGSDDLTEYHRGQDVPFGMRKHYEDLFEHSSNISFDVFGTYELPDPILFKLLRKLNIVIENEESINGFAA